MIYRNTNAAGYVETNAAGFAETGTAGPGAVSTIIDDFEDNDIAEYNGATGDYTTVTSPVFNGTYALEGATAGGDNNVIASTSGLNTYPSQGDSFRYAVQLASTSNVHRVGWATQTSTGGNDGYTLRINANTSEFELFTDATVLVEDTSVSYTAGIWYVVEVTWESDGTQTVTLWNGDTEVTTISATDTTYTGGGIQFQTNDGSGSSNGYFDYVGII